MCSTVVAWYKRAYIYGCHGLIRMLLGALIHSVPSGGQLRGWVVVLSTHYLNRSYQYLLTPSIHVIKRRSILTCRRIILTHPVNPFFLIIPQNEWGMNKERMLAMCFLLHLAVNYDDRWQSRHFSVKCIDRESNLRVSVKRTICLCANIPAVCLFFNHMSSFTIFCHPWHPSWRLHLPHPHHPIDPFRPHKTVQRYLVEIGEFHFWRVTLSLMEIVHLHGFHGRVSPVIAWYGIDSIRLGEKNEVK